MTPKTAKPAKPTKPTILITTDTITPWKRAGKQRNGHYYDTQLDLKEAYAFDTLRQMKAANIDSLGGGLIASFVFIKKRPLAHKKLLNPPVFCNTTPDIDNLAKFIFDAFKYVPFIEDDCKFTQMCAIKIWGSSNASFCFLAEGALSVSSTSPSPTRHIVFDSMRVGMDDMFYDLSEGCVISKNSL